MTMPAILPSGSYKNRWMDVQQPLQVFPLLSDRSRCQFPIRGEVGASDYPEPEYGLIRVKGAG